MLKPSSFESGRFLNRVALHEVSNAAEPDPYLILDKLFSFLSPERLQRSLKDFCDAALTEDFSWKKGSPGRLIVLAEKLELLMEACFLITNVTKEEDAPRKARRQRKGNRVELESQEGGFDAAITIRDFFAYASLPQWKLDLYQWTEAALSNYPIIESADASAVLHFYQHISALIRAAYEFIPIHRNK